MKVQAVIVAAGSGTRLGYDMPKAFVPLKGEPMLLHPLRTFDTHPAVSSVILVVPYDLVMQTRALVSEAGLLKVTAVIAGGKERKDSVANGLRVLDSDTDTVLIHDGARPLVSAGVIDRVIIGVMNEKAAFPAVPAVDTVKRFDAKTGIVKETLNRDELCCVQTPQGFRVELVPYLLKRAGELTNAFDEAMLAEEIVPVQAVQGEQRNFKITVEQDLKLAELIA
jgi:2-C-methyl-D-erythritol 4-phosphate cytidylyltransferase